MSNTEDFFKTLGDNPVIAVLRAPNEGVAQECIAACARGGLKNIEITLSTPNAVAVLKKAKENFPELNLGFGTITNAKEARETLINEASFIVSPHSDAELFEYYQSKNITYIPGGSTPSELMHIFNHNFLIQKLFPGSLYGPKGVKGILAPLPQLNLIVTGGVKLENARDFLASGAKAVCVGGNLFTADVLTSGNYSWLEQEARKWSEIKCD